MKAIIKANENEWSLQVAEMPRPKAMEGQILVRIKATGICGTDFSILNNKYIGRKPVPLPIILGHEGAGYVEEVGAGVKALKEGDRVAIEPIAGCGSCYQCLTGHKNLCENWEHIGITRHGTFAEYISIPEKLAHKIPDNIDYKEAALAEPFGLVVRSLEQSKPIVGETMAIIGPGSIGLMHLLVFKAAGISKIIMVGLEKDRKRLEVAKKIGADFTIVIDEVDPKEYLLECNNGNGADIVLETAGSPKAAQLAFELAAPQGRVILFGLYPLAEFSPLNMLRKGLTVYGSVGQVTRHFIKAIKVIETIRLKLKDIIHGGFELNQAQAAFDMAKKREAVKVLFEL